MLTVEDKAAFFDLESRYAQAVDGAGARSDARMVAHLTRQPGVLIVQGCATLTGSSAMAPLADHHHHHACNWEAVRPR